MRVHWTNRAKARLRDIQTEIERDRPLVARDVVEKILRRSWMLGESPNVGHSVRGFETTELLEVLLRPYRIIYRIKPTQVDVVTVLHYRQLLEKDLRGFKNQ